MKTILQLGNPILRALSQTIQIEDIHSEQIQNIIKELIDTLATVGGIGLAAPQIGHSTRIILIRPKPTATRPHLTDLGPIIMINPEITKHSDNIIYDREGCLSIPKAESQSMIYAKVPRYEQITTHYLDRDGNQQQGEYNNLIARIIQHEIDHLDGVLFIDTADISTRCSYEEYQKQL